MTQQTLADLAGVSLSTVKRIERGAMPRAAANVIAAIARALDVQQEELFEPDGEAVA